MALGAHRTCPAISGGSKTAATGRFSGFSIKFASIRLGLASILRAMAGPASFPPNWRRLGKSARDDQLVKLILDTASMVRHHNRKPTRGHVDPRSDLDGRAS